MATALAALYERTGPFLTIYLDTDPTVENAAQHSETRWKTLRRDLEGVGVPSSTLDAIAPLVPDAHQQGSTLAVVADAERLLDVEHHPEPPRKDVGFWAPLPRLGPLFEWRQSEPTHILVVADRVGADIIVVHHQSAEVRVEAGGDDFQITKPNAGGWSQSRFQDRAENTWEHNADDVAERLTKLVEQYEPRLIVATGEVRAMQLLRDALPKEVLEILDEVEGDPKEIADLAVRRVATAVARDTVELIEKFKEERGQHDRAAAGIDDTVTALRAAQVEVLLVHDDPDDDHQVFFGTESANLVATTEQALRDLGVDKPLRGRLVDVALRAAVGTGAAVRIIPGGRTIDEGIGAILRWS
jgi:peptide subunit release factor 1 (eRF1)